MKKKVVVLTGAGMSAESGLKTFRDGDGLWENHRVEEVATPQAFARDPEKVMRFYNQRRKQLLTVAPNSAHHALADLETSFDVTIITQNIDNLHEAAGSTCVLHLHGELLKVRSVQDEQKLYDWKEDLNLGDVDDKGIQLRPHVVWFGESVPMIGPAVEMVAAADVILVIGSSMQVYPAAGLVQYAAATAPIYYIDPHPQLNHELSHRKNLVVIEEKATTGVPKVVDLLSSRTK